MVSRAELKKQISKENQLGKRIKWIREKVKVGFRDIEKELGIPESNIRSMENGGRTTIYEDLLHLSAYFTRELKKKYKTINPTYQGQEVEEITVLWLMFGVDHNRAIFNKTIEIVREDFREREMELIERNFGLDMELTRLRQEIRENEQNPSD